MEYRRPLPEDYAQIIQVQNRNLFSALAAEERLDGFLNTAFTIADFQKMDQSVGVIVAVEAGQVHGYLCAATFAFYLGFPFPAACIHQAERISHQGRLLRDYRACLVNPICIDQAHRGTDVFTNLSQAMLDLWPRDRTLLCRQRQYPLPPRLSENDEHRRPF